MPYAYHFDEGGNFVGFNVERVLTGELLEYMALGVDTASLVSSLEEFIIPAAVADEDK